jgi:single-strand DNA-binding protein
MNKAFRLHEGRADLRFLNRGGVMAGINKVILVGRLGGDPEIRYTNTGTAVANFSMATSTNWTNKDGEREEKTEWHRIVAFGRLGEICGEYLNKGKQVYVEGRLQTRSWEDKDGNRRKTTEIIAQQLQMLGAPSGERPPAEEEAVTEGEEPIPEDDIPF